MKSKAPSPEQIDGRFKATPIIRLPRPRCPNVRCGSTQLQTNGSQQKDGLTIRYSRCTVCGQRVHVLVE